MGVQGVGLQVLYLELGVKAEGFGVQKVSFKGLFLYDKDCMEVGLHDGTRFLFKVPPSPKPSPKSEDCGFRPVLAS